MTTQAEQAGGQAGRGSMPRRLCHPPLPSPHRRPRRTGLRTPLSGLPWTGRWAHCTAQTHACASAGCTGAAHACVAGAAFPCGRGVMQAGSGSQIPEQPSWLLLAPPPSSLCHSRRLSNRRGNDTSPSCHRRLQQSCSGCSTGTVACRGAAGRRESGSVHHIARTNRLW